MMFTRLGSLGLFGVALTLTISLSAQAIILERLEASVNSQIVLKSDVKKFRQTLGLRAQLDPLFSGTPLAAEGAKASDKAIIDFLIDEKMITQAFPMTDAEVETEISSIQSNNHLTRDQLKAALTQQGFTFEEYFDLIRIGSSKRNLIDREIRTKVSISDDDVKNYYYNHYAKGESAPTAYRVKIITANPSNFKRPRDAKDVMDRARASLKAGESFDDVAKKMSDDASATQGGDMGLMTEGQMSPTIKTELRKMKIGEVSSVLGNDQSQYFILKLVDVQTDKDAEIKRVSNEIRSTLAAGEYQRQIALWLERQRQTSFIHRANDPTVAGMKPKK